MLAGKQDKKPLVMPAREEPYALTIAEAAARLGVSRAYAYQLANDGTLPTVRLGRRILVPAEAIARLLTVA